MFLIIKFVYMNLKVFLDINLAMSFSYMDSNVYSKVIALGLLLKDRG